MPIQITPDRSAEILQHAFDARDRKEYEQAQLAQQAQERSLREQMLQLQLQDRQDQMARQQDIGQTIQGVPQSENISSGGVAPANALSDYAQRQGVNTIKANPDFSQPFQSTVNIPPHKQYIDIANALAAKGYAKEAKEYFDLAEKAESKKDEQEYNLAYGYWKQDPINWKQNMLRDFPQAAEEINRTEFTPSGTAIYEDKERGGFWYRDKDGKEEFKANANKGSLAHNVQELVSPDGKTAQKFQYNADTNRYDIPIGQPYKVKSQVSSITVQSPNYQFAGTTTDGNPIVFNPKTAEFTEKPMVGKGRIQPKNEPSVAVDTAAKLQMMEQGQKDLQLAKDLIFDKNGKVNRSVIVQASGGVPFSKGRDLRSYILNAVEGKLRIESGAAVPKEEVKRIAVRFIPSALDSDATINQKIQRLDEYLVGSAKKLDPYGRINKNKTNQKPLSKATQDFLDRKKQGQ